MFGIVVCLLELSLSLTCAIRYGGVHLAFPLRDILLDIDEILLGLGNLLFCRTILDLGVHGLAKPPARLPAKRSRIKKPAK